MNPNLEIYNKNYSDHNLAIKTKTAYDEYMIALRFSFIEKYGAGRDVLDLCCGTGSYLIPVLNRVRSAVGVDFSSNMLNGFKKNLGGKIPSNLTLLEGDATNLSIPDQSFDFVFSYTSLYYIPNVGAAIGEVSRVLRPGGYAVLELGNVYNINTIICNLQYKDSGWAKPFYIPYGKMWKYLQSAGLDVLEWRPFQILPMYGTPKRLFYLYPLLSPVWKKIMGLQMGGRMLDELISRSWPLRFFAFRHIFLVTKR